MKIGIYALGLIGGSLLKALHGYEKIAVTRNLNTLKAAKPYASIVTDDINALRECDLVFVCTPMEKTLETLDCLEKVVSKNTIVADVCSLKEFVLKKKRPYKFIGTHPMAGTEHSGFEHSFKELFEGAKWVITPSDDVCEDDVSKLKQIISSVWAKPIVMDAKEHDKAAALISHMPLLISQALVEVCSQNENAKLLAASGFRDMTRLAMSNVQMASDMLEMNRENIETALGLLSGSILTLLSGDYKEHAKKLCDLRKSLYDEEGKNIF